jgi:hypothetical protein
VHREAHLCTSAGVIHFTPMQVKLQLMRFSRSHLQCIAYKYQDLSETSKRLCGSETSHLMCSVASYEEDLWQVVLKLTSGPFMRKSARALSWQVGASAADRANVVPQQLGRLGY